MAPEVLRGRPCTPAGDVHAVGAVVFEMLTGETHVNLEGRTPVDLMHAVLHQPPRLPHSRVPAPFAPVLERALAKDPLERYQSAREMRAALEGAWASVRVSTS